MCEERQSAGEKWWQYFFEKKFKNIKPGTPFARL